MCTHTTGLHWYNSQPGPHGGGPHIPLRLDGKQEASLSAAEQTQTVLQGLLQKVSDLGRH